MKQLLLLLFFGITLNSFAINHAPVALNDTLYFSYAEIHEADSFLMYLTFLDNDSDPDGDHIHISDIIYSGANDLLPSVLNNRVLWLFYYAQPNYSGTETFQYILNDDGTPVLQDTATVTIVVMRKGYEQLNVNNVKATIKKDVLFSSPTGSSPGFETPINSGISSIFSSNIWISGLNNGVVQSNIRKFGGHTYTGTQTSNNGPVSTNSHTDSLFNTKWDRVWKVSQRNIDYHILHWTEDDYVPSSALLDWPGHGNILLGEAQFLAPYVDVNQDSLYNPFDGDYPIIKGDQAIYFIYNDGNSPISITPMITEVHGMAYAFRCQDSALQNTIFVDYKIYNRSSNTYDSTYIGMWSDMDVGNSNDDYMQCDVMRNLFFMFNGDDFDEPNGASPGYKAHPGSQGVIILKGAKKDSDGLDNPFGILAEESVNGKGFGDGISDNEYWGLSYFTFFTNSNSALGDPQNELEHYNFLHGKWKGGDDFVYGGLGFPNGGQQITSRYAFPDSSDIYFYGTNGQTVTPWNEYNTGNAPGDRRGVGSTGPFTFKPGESIELSYAFVFGRDYSTTGAQAGVNVMLERVDSVQSYYNQGLLQACGFPLSVQNQSEENKKELLIYPNPTQNIFYIKQQSAQKIQIEVIDATGKIVLHSSGQDLIESIDLTEFTNGLYFIKVRSEGKVTVQKLIKK